LTDGLLRVFSGTVLTGNGVTDRAEAGRLSPLNLTDSSLADTVVTVAPAHAGP